MCTDAHTSSLALAIIVVKAAPSVLDHTFTPRDLFSPRSAVAWLWSIVSVALLWLLLLDVGLFVGLLVDQGRLSINIPREELSRFREVTGLSIGREAQQDQEVPANKEPEAGPAEGAMTAPKPEVATTVQIVQDDMGILPSVWRSRNAWWGGVLAGMFRSVDLFKSNILSAIVLLALGAILVLARAIALFQFRKTAHRMALNAVVPIRRNVHRQALRLGPEDLDGSGLAMAKDVFLVQIERLRKNIEKRVECDIRFIVELICLALVAVSIEPLLSAQYLLFLGIVWYHLEKREREAEASRQIAEEQTAAELNDQAEGFRSARLVRGLGIDQQESDHFAQHLIRLSNLTSKEATATDAARYLRIGDIAACAALGSFLLFLLTTHVLNHQSEFSFTGAFIFLSVTLLSIAGIRRVRSRSSLVYESKVAADKIHVFLDKIPTVSQAVGARFLQPLSKVLHFDSVSYRAPSGKLLLDELDLTLTAGRTYSLVSLDPMESRTLVSLLPRFIEPQRGRILFDGEDIAWATLESLRAETVFVGADDPLLPGSILDNIRGGRTEYTLQQAIEAAKLTHAHNFIVTLNDGYESDVPDRADQMDASQRFRLGLARAMIRNPALLIIEEPRVPLDDDTKHLLADAYDRICRDRTVIFLPGRMSTVRRSDQVVVLNEGRVAAIGPQSTLSGVSEIYLHWEYVNFNVFRHKGGDGS